VQENKQPDKNQNLQIVLEKILDRNRKYYQQGRVASYIPALARANSQEVGISLVNTDGDVFGAGDYQVKFSIQSISKVLILMLALLDKGQEAVFAKVGMEPSGKSFNSIESINDEGKPYNPLINAGAIAVTSLIKGSDNQEKSQRMIDFVHKLTANDNLKINRDIYLSEKRTGNKNRTLAYYLKEKGIIEGNVEEILDLYFRQCSILVTAKDLANIAAVLANNGKKLDTGEQIVPREIVKLVRALMVTCGLYNESGVFAVRVGLPAKSGVGGGMMAVVPGQMGIATYGPALDENGNSITGLKMLEDLSQEQGLNLF